ncbi:MAG: glycosyl hydrolase family 28-related protein [Phycisphaerae bacterium]|jgi:polygalacturonase|nr:glycosyl hydrolase family 28-related protein [Phycisphaerae bacterium]
MDSMKSLRILLVLICILLFGTNSVCAQSTSRLWGRTGEKWNPKGRLPDFSHAGYHSGAKAIPTVKQVADVKMFGAKGDGRSDDSDAFIKALAAVKSGAIYIPPGRYKITKIIEIRKSGIVLRGAGANKTILVFPKPLNDIKPNMGSTTSGRPTSNYSWGGGFI